MKTTSTDTSKHLPYLRHSQSESNRIGRQTPGNKPAPTYVPPGLSHLTRSSSEGGAGASARPRADIALFKASQIETAKVQTSDDTQEEVPLLDFAAHTPLPSSSSSDTEDAQPLSHPLAPNSSSSSKSSDDIQADVLLPATPVSTPAVGTSALHGTVGLQATPAQAAQQAMQTEHTRWKDGVAAKRREFFGANYNQHTSTNTFRERFAQMARGLEPAAFEFIKQGLSSGFTFGVRGGVSTILRTKHNYGAVKAGAVAGIPMGVVNFLVDNFLVNPIGTAQVQMKRPQLTAVPPNVLFPDPSPIRQTVDANGQPHFEAKTELEMLDEKDEIRLLRQSCQRSQDRASGKGSGSHVVATTLAAGNTIRRAADRNPAASYGGIENGVASFIGGGAGKGALELVKAYFFQEVDDLHGGSQTLPMFVLKPPAANAPPAPNFSVGAFAQHVGSNISDTAIAMAKRPWEAAKELLITNMFANVFSSAVAEGVASGIEVKSGQHPEMATALTKQAVQSYTNAAVFRQNKNTAQVPEQNNWAADIKTTKERETLRRRNPAPRSTDDNV